MRRTRDEFLEFTKSVWVFPPESAKKVGHPAPFPIELPYRCIQLYTFKGEVILDPQIAQKLPYLFRIAEVESSRAGKIGMEVGSVREEIIVSLLIYKFGEKTSRLRFQLLNQK
jgi:hypothetical protein